MTYAQASALCVGPGRLTGPLGPAIAATDPRRRGFHDTLAGTVVVPATRADGG